MGRSGGKGFLGVNTDDKKSGTTLIYYSTVIFRA